MDKKIQNSQTYDEVFQAQGDAGSYTLPYWQSCYYPLYKRVLRSVRKNSLSHLLEVGCGAGGFAHLLLNKYPDIQYCGFDFSQVAIEKLKSDR